MYLCNLLKDKVDSSQFRSAQVYPCRPRLVQANPCWINSAQAGLGQRRLGNELGHMLYIQITYFERSLKQIIVACETSINGFYFKPICEFRSSLNAVARKFQTVQSEQPATRQVGGKRRVRFLQVRGAIAMVSFSAKLCLCKKSPKTATLFKTLCFI